MARVTAKVKLTTMESPGGAGDDSTTLYFGPDYEDGRNKEWAVFTPALSLTMTVKNEAAAHFNQGDAFTLVFEKDQD